MGGSFTIKVDIMSMLPNPLAAVNSIQTCTDDYQCEPSPLLRPRTCYNGFCTPLCFQNQEIQEIFCLCGSGKDAKMALYHQTCSGNDVICKVGALDKNLLTVVWKMFWKLGECKCGGALCPAFGYCDDGTCKCIPFMFNNINSEKGDQYRCECGSDSTRKKCSGYQNSCQITNWEGFPNLNWLEMSCVNLQPNNDKKSLGLPATLYQFNNTLFQDYAPVHKAIKHGTRVNIIVAVCCGILAFLLECVVVSAIWALQDKNNVVDSEQEEKDDEDEKSVAKQVNIIVPNEENEQNSQLM